MFKRVLMIVVALAIPVTLAAQESPIGVVAQVLSLSDEQVQALSEVLHQRNEALRPVAEQAQALEQALGQQLQAPEPDPLAIGRLAIDVRRIQEQFARVAAEWSRQIETLLNDEQRARLEHIRGAAPACGVIPAFKAAGLL